MSKLPKDIEEFRNTKLRDKEDSITRKTFNRLLMELPEDQLPNIHTEVGAFVELTETKALQILKDYK